VMAIAVPECPYKGLIPYAEEDAPFFFGRESERELITANMIASRLTLLYGSSGVGKSSILRAGVVPDLHRLARENQVQRGAPEMAVVVFSSWRDDPIVRLTDRIKEGLAPHLAPEEREAPLPIGPLWKTLQGFADRLHGDLLIILDQFEEYFLYHEREDGEGTFATEFPRAVNRNDLRVNFVVSIRDDSLARLDRFKGRIPNLFANYLRLDHLGLDAARAAIKEPVGKYNDLRGPSHPSVTIEPSLVETVVSQVKTGSVLLEESGRGVVGSGARAADAAQLRDNVETPYLQLVMTRLWNEEMRTGSRVLRLETLNRLGGAQRIVQTHLDLAMRSLSESERDAAASVFHYLVTPSRSKIVHTVQDLADYAEVPKDDLAPVLEKLAGSRILRAVAPPLDQPNASRYEIFHDVLGAAILDWRSRYVHAPPRARIVLTAGLSAGAAYAAVVIALGLLRRLTGARPPSDLNFVLLGLATLVQAGTAGVIALRVGRLRVAYGVLSALVSTFVMPLGWLGFGTLASDSALTIWGGRQALQTVGHLLLLQTVWALLAGGSVGAGMSPVASGLRRARRRATEPASGRRQALVRIVKMAVFLMCASWILCGLTALLWACLMLLGLPPVLDQSAELLPVLMGGVTAALVSGSIWRLTVATPRLASQLIVSAALLLSGAAAVGIIWAGWEQPVGAVRLGAVAAAVVMQIAVIAGALASQSRVVRGDRILAK